MEIQVNPNLHKVEGMRENDGTYSTPCPHGVAFEYINGWAYRMVGSVTCTACVHNASHKRCMVKEGKLSIQCLHKEGKEKGCERLSIIRTIRS